MNCGGDLIQNKCTGSGGGGSGDLLAANNLSELTDVAIARANLGLGDAALEDVADILADAQTAALTLTLTAEEVVADANYSFVLTDRNKLKVMNSEAPRTMTVEPDATTDFPVGSSFDVSTYGVAGVTTIAAGAGVTINAADNFLKLRTRYSVATLLKTGANRWLLTGDLII